MPKLLAWNTAIKDLEDEAAALHTTVAGGASVDDARLVVAQQYGFVNWRQMVAHLLACSEA